MKITVACTSQPLRRDIIVHSLSFDAASHSFSVPCPSGDDWLQRIHFPLKSSQVTIHLQYDMATVAFVDSADADQFFDWITSAEREAQHGYTTMRG